MLHALSQLCALASLLLASTLAHAQHPVPQLVEWEITANAALTSDSLQRMAAVILSRAEENDLPAPILELAHTYRAAAPEAQAALLASLDSAQLKQIAVLPAPAQYFEIPEAKLQALSTHSSHELTIEGLARAKEYTRFEKEGVPYVRWFLHPLAQAKDSSVAKIFPGLSPVTGTTKFHFTSSRSVILFDGNYDRAISVKESLKAAEGPFKNKAIHLKEFSAWGKHNAYLADALPSGTANLTLQREPYGLGIAAGTQEDAFLFRTIGNKTYLPAFAALNEETGTSIAKLNGSDQPLAFWRQHLLEPLAKGMADLRALTGAEHTSPHSQNLLVELDEKMHPTGKVVIRDFDFYVDKPAFDKFNRVVKDSYGLVKEGTNLHLFALRNGLNRLPSWMQEADYQAWTKQYFETFAKQYSQNTGVPLSAMNTKIRKYNDLGEWEAVEGNKFRTGGRNNYHSIDFADNPDFARYQNQWLAKHQAELGGHPVATPEIINKPEPISPIKDWDALVTELDRNSSFDAMLGRWEKLDPATLDAKARSNLLGQLSRFNFTTKALFSKNPAAILEAMGALGALEPAYLPKYFANVEFNLNRAGATPEQISAAKLILAQTKEGAQAIGLHSSYQNAFAQIR